MIPIGRVGQWSRVASRRRGSHELKWFRQEGRTFPAVICSQWPWQWCLTPHQGSASSGLKAEVWHVGWALERPLWSDLDLESFYTPSNPKCLDSILSWKSSWFCITQEEGASEPGGALRNDVERGNWVKWPWWVTSSPSVSWLTLGKSLNLGASSNSSVKWHNGSLTGLLQGPSGTSSVKWMRKG